MKEDRSSPWYGIGRMAHAPAPTPLGGRRPPAWLEHTARGWGPEESADSGARRSPRRFLSRGEARPKAVVLWVAWGGAGSGEKSQQRAVGRLPAPLPSPSRAEAALRVGSPAGVRLEADWDWSRPPGAQTREGFLHGSVSEACPERRLGEQGGGRRLPSLSQETTAGLCIGLHRGLWWVWPP